MGQGLGDQAEDKKGIPFKCDLAWIACDLISITLRAEGNKFFLCFVSRTAVIHIPAREHREFRSRMPFVPIVNVRGIVVQETLLERFTTAFLEQVDCNGTYQLPSDVVSNV